MPSAPTPHAVSPCDLRTVFRTAAADYGFLQVFFTTPRKFDLGRNRFNLTADAPTAYPWANSIAVLVYPYAPFTADERIPAYYKKAGGSPDRCGNSRRKNRYSRQNAA